MNPEDLNFIGDLIIEGFATETNRLRTLRKLHGLTQKELAKELGISRSHYTQIENRKKFWLFRLDQATKLAEIFGIGVSEIAKLG